MQQGTSWTVGNGEPVVYVSTLLVLCPTSSRPGPRLRKCRMRRTTVSARLGGSPDLRIRIATTARDLLNHLDQQHQETGDKRNLQPENTFWSDKKWLVVDCEKLRIHAG